MKRTSIILSFIFVLVAFAMWANNAEARSAFWSGQGGCVSCHAGEDTSCAGCHAHGTHSDSGKDDINVVASTDKTTYAPGEDVTVSITGGYRAGWVRAILYDENGVEVARSSGSGGTGGGLEFPGPIVLTAPAPADPGLYTWEASWYGNEYDLGNIGGSTFFGPGWIPDPNNANHGEEVVFVNPFDVVAAAECGDGNTDPGEECDDGNNTNGDGCENDCTITPATTTTTTVPATTTTTTVPPTTTTTTVPPTTTTTTLPTTSTTSTSTTSTTSTTTLPPDLCPSDPNKTEPGTCGCGVADTDSDGDETADCVDTDVDGDGFTNIEETQCGSDPINPESKCRRGLPFLMLLLD